MLTILPAPTFATTRFGIVCPATKFRFDDVGRASPPGCTVTNPPAVGPVTVTFRITAETPDAGTPPTPVTSSATVPPAATFAVPGRPTPDRVSSTRAGPTAEKSDVLGKYPTTS